MNKLSKTNRIIVIILVSVIALSALGIAGWRLSYYFTVGGRSRVGDKSISFASDVVFTMKDAVTAPASGVTRRSLRASIYNGETLDDNASVSYRMSKSIPGVSIENGMLNVSSSLEKSTEFTVYAYDTSDERLCISKKVKVIKDKTLSDYPASPIEKDGWALYYNDEFNGNELDYSSWSPYYLRNWVQNDEQTRANYFFENGALVLRADEDTESWSPQNKGVKVSGISSYEKNYLHKFGELGTGAVFNKDIPVFDGISTKYGYFEMRLKMPDTKDGSHFAWWMVGSQEDMNDIPILNGDNEPMASHYSNETGEIDIIETTIADKKAMKNWRPVIHPNGTTDYKYDWLPSYTIPGNPSLEYHVYGFMWDESGVKFYVDGKLASESDRSPSYKMMTFITTYATGGLGGDRGIYPKDAHIDYFRIYKRANEINAPSSVSLSVNNRPFPDELFIPSDGESTVNLSAVALNSLDEKIEADIKWRLSSTVDGFSPENADDISVTGVTLLSDGKIIIGSNAVSGTDLFITAFVNNEVKQTKHIKLSKNSPRDVSIYFHTSERTINKGGELDVTAILYDQYGNPRSDVWCTYSLSADITGKTATDYDGVTLSSDGKLFLSESTALKQGDIIIVTAFAGSKMNNIFIKVA